MDGSPPLYYFLLHFWTRIFGTSDLAVRSLPGLIGAISVPVAWKVGMQFGGKVTASACSLIMLSSPFAIWYSTDNRMYSLLALESLFFIWFIQRCRANPTKFNAALLVVDTCALVYTHYWSFFLIGVISIALIAELAFFKRPGTITSLIAIGIGIAAFIPWLGIFLFQLHHTGTPWTVPADLSVINNAITEFAGGNSGYGSTLKIILLVLVILGLFGKAIDTRRVELDLARPKALPAKLAAIFLGSLVLAVIVGKFANSGFQPRYASVAFPAFIITAAIGARTLACAPLRFAVMGLVAILGFIAASPNINTDRTQATNVAAVIKAHSKPADVVAYCPDQLGPDTSRLLPRGLVQTTFPRGTSPNIVNWINYLKAVKAANPAAFVRKLVSLAGEGHNIWYVWRDGYRGFGNDCSEIATGLAQARSNELRLVYPNGLRYYEPSHLYEFPPNSPQSANGFDSPIPTYSGP